MRIIFWTLLICLTTAALDVSAVPQSSEPSVLRDEARITKQFQERVKAYVQLQKQLEHMLPALKQTRDEGEIHEHQLALRKLVADARRHAHRGDIFTKDISRYYRAVTTDVLHSAAAPVVEKTIKEREAARPIEVRVNIVFPDDVPVQTTPPLFLMRFPVLSMELSYRFVGRSLVLLDNKTNLIVDFIPDILP